VKGRVSGKKLVTLRSADEGKFGVVPRPQCIFVQPVSRGDISQFRVLIERSDRGRASSSVSACACVAAREPASRSFATVS